MKTLVLVFSLLFLSLNSIQAASAGDVLINEVAWMGTKTSYSNEWIELYNNTDSPINLDGWVLKAADGVPTINLKSAIPAKDFYLSERSKDYTGALNNKGEKLELYDSLGNLIDSVDCLAGWPAGDNETKQTMERKDLHVWQTSQNPGGTPKAKNSIIAQAESQPKTEPKKPALDDAIDDSHQRTYPRVNNELAAVGKQTTQKSPFFLLVAGALAIFSGIMILMLKRGLK